MADLNITGEALLASKVQTRILDMRESMDQRKEIWDRISYEKKKLWITSGKDPMMTLAWNTYRYLRDNFFDQEVDNG